MDARFRRLEKEWRASGDVEAHARLLGLLVRSGELTIKRMLCAAYLGHSAAKLVVHENVKPKGVIFKCQLLPNIEIRDQIYFLRKWGLKITWRASLGVARLINSNLTYNPSSKLIDALARFVKEETEEARMSLRSISSNWGRQRYRVLYDRGVSRRQSRLINQLYGLTGSLSAAKDRRGNGLNEMRTVAADFPDKQIRKAMRSEIYPFLLGEYE